MEVKYTGDLLIGGDPDSGDVIVRKIFTDECESEFYAGITMPDGTLCVCHLYEMMDGLVGVSIAHEKDEGIVSLAKLAAESLALKALASA